MTSGQGPVPALVLLSADWAGPSRPAPTLLRELARRWGPAMHTILLEDPSDEILDRWDVTHLPTWLRFVPERGRATPAGAPGPPTEFRAPDGPDDRDRDLSAAPQGTEALREEILRGLSPGGAELALDGPWVLTHRRSGALPKHVVESELGPDADR